MNVDRRSSPRVRANVYFNKYIDGQPYLCEALELSATGMLARRVHEPDAPLACYALELAGTTDEAERLWLCATPVWTNGDLQALSFVAQSDRDRKRIADLLATMGEAA